MRVGYFKTMVSNDRGSAGNPDYSRTNQSERSIFAVQ